MTVRTFAPRAVVGNPPYRAGDGRRRVAKGAVSGSAEHGCGVDYPHARRPSAGGDRPNYRTAVRRGVCPVRGRLVPAPLDRIEHAQRLDRAEPAAGSRPGGRPARTSAARRRRRDATCGTSAAPSGIATPDERTSRPTTPRGSPSKAAHEDAGRLTSDSIPVSVDGPRPPRVFPGHPSG